MRKRDAISWPRQPLFPVHAHLTTRSFAGIEDLKEKREEVNRQILQVCRRLWTSRGVLLAVLQTLRACARPYTLA